MKIKPLEDRVVVKAQDAEEVSNGGIILPDTAQEKPQQGEIVAIGPGKASDSGNLIKLTVKNVKMVCIFACVTLIIVPVITIGNTDAIYGIGSI